MGQSAKITLVPKNTSSNKKTEDQKMCHPSQSSPNQIHAWQGVYPDLNAFNDLFSPTSPQPNPQEQRQSAQEQPSAPPATEQEPAAQTFAFAGPNVYSQTSYPGDQASGTQSAPGAHGCHQGTNQSRRSPQSCGFSCNSPHIKQLFQAITSRLLHFSSVATRASI